MKTTLLSRRYTQALLNTLNPNAYISTFTELVRIISSIESKDSIQKCFKDQTVQGSTKKAILEQILSNIQNKDPIKYFLFYLIDKKRITLLSEIKNDAETILLQLNKKVLGEFITAHEIEKTEQQKIQENLSKQENKEIKLEFKTNKSLIGGFQLKFGNTIYDKSIVNSLNKLSKQFNEN